MRCLLPLLLLAACGGPPAVCRMQAMADLPATAGPDGLVIPGQVDRSPVTFVLDTAAERTVLTPSTADYLMLARVGADAGAPAREPGDAAPAFADITLGGLEVQRRFRVATVTSQGGVIGGELLSGDALDLDVPDDRVGLWRVTGCVQTTPQWSGPRAALPAKITDGDLVRVPVTIDGQTVQAVLDSAAPVSLMQMSVARRLGVTAAGLAAAPKVAALGVDGKSQQVPVYMFGTMVVGQERVVNPRIGVGPTGTNEMVLGLDFLRDHRVWVSYPTGQVFVQVVPGNGAG